MNRSDPAAQADRSRSALLSLNKGDLLGKLDRDTAERSFRLYQAHSTARLLWSGSGIEAHLARPAITVTIDESDTGELGCRCTKCGVRSVPCAHAAAALMRWLDVRATLVRLGAGSAWRAHSRHPFVAPSRGAEDRVDLGHLTGADLRSALELQLSLQKNGTASVRLEGQEVQIRITLPSGDQRLLVFSATVLPSALPLLRAMPRMSLQGDLEQLELSEVRLHPVLAAAWTDDGVVLEPGYRLGNRSVLSSTELEGRIHGRWARVGRHLCRILDPPTPLVPFHRRGRVVLEAREALRFLSLDHPQLRQHAWYLPQGALAEFQQLTSPKPTRIDVSTNSRGAILLRPTFTAGDRDVGWSRSLDLINSGFARIGGKIVHAPDLWVFENAGFRLPKRGRAKGLVGDRIAFVRLIAETDLEVTSENQGLCDLVAVLRGDLVLDLGPPPGLLSTLRPYQQDGLRWLWQRYLAGIGALLADDMGLGKTHQIMGLLCLVRTSKPDAPLLVVCPRGVLEHWHNLMDTFAPSLGVHRFHGSDRRLPNPAAGNPVILTTFDILVRSAKELCAIEWDLVVFDEAQRIKNPRTKAARSSRKLKASFRAALTGTPLENRLLELWSVVDLILPGYLGSEREFKATYRNPSQQDLAVLRRRLGVLTLRRLKEQVLSDLPEKVEDIRFCNLTREQRILYETIHSGAMPGITAMLEDEAQDIPFVHIFALMTRLKQVCDHAALGGSDEGPAGTTSGKLEVFDEILDESIDSGQQVVVFSQYVKMLELLSEHLDARKVPHLSLTGSTRDRGRIVRRFNSGQHEGVLLASLLAGGVGIDLTGASVVIHYDRWWNPAKENQATDRVHRMGQKKFVHVFKLVTRNTIEERIDEMIRDKSALFEEVVVPTEAIMRTLSRHEIARVLGISLDAGSADKP